MPSSFFMPGHPQPLMVTTVPMYRQVLLNRVYNSTDVVWSLDPATLKLIKWHWCMAWNLAAAPLIVVQRLVHARKRIVLSANSRCGYLGQSPPLTESSKRLQQTRPLQRVYQVVGIPVQTFPPRGKLGGFPGAQSAYRMLRRKRSEEHTSELQSP